MAAKSVPDPKPEATKSADPKIVAQLTEEIDYLEKNNGGIKSLRYFYEVYKEIYGNRVRELEQYKRDGKKIIGTFCNFVPEELIIAAGAIPIRLVCGSQEPILPAEEVLPRNFCPLIKSSYGFTLTGFPHFDLADVIIVPTTCDGKKKLSEMLSEVKPTWVLEVPHTTETPQARELWLKELQLLKKQLESLTGNKITGKKLKAAVELLNKKRAATRRLYNIRKSQNPKIWGRDALMVTNLGIYDDPKRWTERVNKLCDELEARTYTPCPVDSPRIMLTGSPIVMPTWKIPVLIEESGGIIVVDDICTGSKGLWDPVEVSYFTMIDMMIGLADKYLMNTCPCFTPNSARVDRIISLAKDYSVDGALYHVLQACHLYGMEQLRVEKALGELKIPVLNIETDYSQEDVEQIRTRIEAFIEMIQSKRSIKAVKPSISKPPVAAKRAPKPAPSQDDDDVPLADRKLKPPGQA
jgi:benzoyl-CoA reductase/2-hydroxyglutaryl-CoA dehydratase subunit BcrC/BadD/HgdB